MDFVAVEAIASMFHKHTLLMFYRSVSPARSPEKGKQKQKTSKTQPKKSTTSKATHKATKSQPKKATTSQPTGSHGSRAKNVAQYV